MPRVEAQVWRRARDLFEQIVELPDNERSAFLDRSCAEELDLRQAVERLLAADASPERGFGDSAVVTILEDAIDQPLRQSLGNYRLLCKIGVGGMGTVYLAERVDKPGRRVAVKLLRPILVHSATAGRFRLETQVLASLKHPNITRLLDDGITDEGRPYLVMEWIQGRPITTYCDDKKIDIRGRLKLVRTLAKALHYAHSQRLVHRDLKPSNVLVTQEGIPKLLDFGIVKVLAGSPIGVQESTTTLQRPLTLVYASPEQADGETVGIASDLYSLGVLTYELVTGGLPAEKAALSFPRGDLGRVLRKAMTRAVDQRYASAMHFADDLKHLTSARSTFLTRLRLLWNTSF